MIRITLAAVALAVVASGAQAQTRPAVRSLGPNYPKTEMFIGNSFFYYNNGLPGHVSLLEKAADPAHKSRSPVGNSYHATIDEPTARLLQEVAWETVQDYYGK